MSITHPSHRAARPLSVVLALVATALAAPDFSLVGFATQNGGTTGGKGGTTVTVTNYADLKKHAESASPMIIMIQGTITNGTAGGQIRVKANKSLLGVGSSAFLSGVGLDISSQNNVIVRNLKITLVGTTTPSAINGGDLISISGTSKNIWIDHCELYSENPSVQTDKDKYDGLLDIKGQTGFITLSWNYLHDHHKGGLVGAADDDLNDDRKVTMHHNHYKNVLLRVPMYRGSTGHFFNNYIVGAKDATEIRANTCVRVEKNYYESLNYSIYTPADSPGKTERIDNIEVKRASRAYPANCVASIPYSYSAVLTSTTADVKTIVPQYAGVGKLDGTTSVERPILPSSAHEGSRTFDLLGRTAPSEVPERSVATPKVQGP
jgi:pectate lyase